MINVTLRNQILQLITGKIKTISGTGFCYLGLSRETPDNDGSNFDEPTECASYSRVQLNVNTAMEYTDKFGSVSNGVVTNAEEICTHECLEDDGWGLLTHFGIFSQETGGTPLAFDYLTDPEGEPDENGVYPAKTLEITKNKVAVFRVGTLQLKIE